MTTTLHNGDVYTICNTDTIIFDGIGSIRLIVAGIVYIVEVNDSKLCFIKIEKSGDDSIHPLITGLSTCIDIGEALSIEIISKSPQFIIVANFKLLSKNPYIFTAKLIFPICIPKLPLNFRTYIVKPIAELGPGPFPFSQFNRDNFDWLLLVEMVCNGTICSSDLPNEPKIENYYL